MPKPAGNTRALLVEDDPNIVDLIRSNLAVRGFDTVVSVDGLRALNLLETEEPDIVLLDLTLPEIDGFELCQLIRERSPVAIIVVSARGGERDKVTALNMGADDYMTKPFSIEELLARITATLRRTRPADTAPQSAPPVITIGQVEIDLASQQVRRDGVPVHLTPTEFALLRELAINRGKLLTHAHLLRRVWGRGYETETEYVRVYVRRLRAKLETDGREPRDPHPAAGGLPDRRGVTAGQPAGFKLVPVSARYRASLTPATNSTVRGNIIARTGTLLMFFSRRYGDVYGSVYRRSPTVFPDRRGPAASFAKQPGRSPYMYPPTARWFLCIQSPRKWR